MDRLASAGLLLSRVLLSGVFLFSGSQKILHFAQTQGYMEAAGMRMTGLFLAVAILFELGGGLSLLLGCYPRLGALALLVFLAPVTLVFHRALGDPGQAAHFAKNVAIMGGLLAIVSAGGGDLSVGCGTGAP